MKEIRARDFINDSLSFGMFLLFILNDENITAVILEVIIS